MSEEGELTVIIPAYNEGKNIRQVIETLPANVDNIVVINDGSNDHTEREILNSNRKVHLVTHPHNMGKGRALRTGFEYLKQNRMDILNHKKSA
ncbi:MAG: glycosyltransferase, partial [Candidatus Kariarchaeaceae archaeon]